MKEIPLIDCISSDIIRVLTTEEINQEYEKWDAIYCPFSKKDKEAIFYSQFKWHVFSYEKYSSLCENEAIDAYNRQEAIEYFVLPQLNIWPKEVGFVTNSLPSPELGKEKKDFYIYPKNLAWTMAFTHENEWLGPYFAKHRDYKLLNNKNIQALQAKQSGW